MNNCDLSKMYTIVQPIVVYKIAQLTKHDVRRNIRVIRKQFTVGVDDENWNFFAEIQWKIRFRTQHEKFDAMPSFTRSIWRCCSTVRTYTTNHIACSCVYDIRVYMRWSVCLCVCECNTFDSLTTSYCLAIHERTVFDDSDFKRPCVYELVRSKELKWRCMSHSYDLEWKWLQL